MSQWMVGIILVFLIVVFELGKVKISLLYFLQCS